MAESTTIVNGSTPQSRLREWMRPQVSRLAAYHSESIFDLLVALVVSAGLLFEAQDTTGSIRLEVLLLSLPLIWRRQYPLPVFGVVLVGAILGVGQAQYFGFFCIIVSAYSVGAFSRYRIFALAIFLATAIGIDIAYGGALPHFPDQFGPFLILIPFWLIGMAMRTRQLRADAMEDRATRLERESEQITRLALAEERSRIARELHDVVAHSVSVMVVQAGAARQVLTSSPEDARAALLAVEAGGREAMGELRNLLGLLHEEGTAVGLAPRPGIEGLEMLVQRVCDAGLPVDLRVEGSPSPLPAGLDQAAYRIVQEALTNCLKYAGPARTEVVVEYREHELKLEILDDGPGFSGTPGNPNLGRGLMGMRERVAIYGGRIEVGPRLGRGYAVRAWLPLVEAPA